MKLKHFIQLIFTKVQLNLKSEAKKSYLSYLWWILEPALFVGVFYLVFGVFLAKGTSDFLVFLLCGQVPFLWFARTLLNSSASIEQGRGLMQQIKIPKIFFPLVTIFQDLFKSVCVFVLFFIFLYFYGFPPSEKWVALPLVILTQLIVISSLSLFVSMIVPFIPDLKFFVNTAIQLTMFASGIFYSYKQVLLEKHHVLYMLNPIANLIEQYRNILLYGQWPSFVSLMWISVVFSLVFILCALFLKRFDSDYPRILAQ
ncbi:ABC transporter permease [Pseudoalteromonas sp. SSM20]|uniref:ABC transporter permease n=1 Tax=Pseudoalteromonas sp. SSM20 TaxID=3139394 RepID=UPI003BAC8234